MTNDLTALKKKHAELGDEIARLEKQGENPWGITTEEGSSYSVLNQKNNGAGFFITTYPAGCIVDGPVFRTEAAAQRIAIAFQVMLELRAPELGAAAIIEDEQWILHTGKNANLFAANWRAIENKSFSISPCFPTRETAHHAIATVGESRIIAAFRTLAGLEA